MKNLVFYAFLLLLAGCRGEVQDSWLTSEKASAYFDTIRAACDGDNGRLWGKNLYGPLLLVDRATRKVTANFPDNEGLLKEKNGIYTGYFPKDFVINNNPVWFGDMLFAMAPLPAAEDRFRLVSRAIRGLFHEFQESEGYSVPGYNTVNLDDKNARLWIKLEWKALRKALTTEGSEQQVALRDALIFRGARRELYQKSAADVTLLENYEGLATFTYLLLSTGSPDEYNKRLFETLDRFYSMSSFATSYGIHGALYATLMYRKGFDFSTVRSDNLDLADKVRELYGIQLPAVCRDVSGSLAMNYDLETVIQEEAKREMRIKDDFHRRISVFTEKPVVYLELESPYFDFEPEDISPMDTLGIIYSRMRVSDNWGKLTVDKGGCLLSNNLKIIRIPARGFKSEKNRIEGDGWHISLNEGWQLIPLEQNYLVRRLMP